MTICGWACRSPAARASTTSVTAPVSRSIPARHVVPRTFAHTSPPAQARSFSQRTRCSPHRTWTTARGPSVTGSRRTSSLVPSLVTTSSTGISTASGPVLIVLSTGTPPAGAFSTGALSTGTAQIPQPSRLNGTFSARSSVPASQRSATRSCQVSCTMLPPTRQIPSAKSSAGNPASAAPSAAPSLYRRSTDIPYCPPDSQTVSPSAISPWVKPRPGCGSVRTTFTRKNRIPRLSTGAQGLDQRGEHRVQVAHDRVVGASHHRGGRVGVDRDDVLGARAAGEMLDGAADPAGQVEVGGDLGAGLADLHRVRAPAFRGHPAGYADHAAEQPGQFLKRREPIGAAHASAAAD